MFKETYYSEEIEFEASKSLETNRIPDFYHYSFSNGRLFSPVTNTPVENEILRRDSVEEAEFQAFRKIQTWAGRRDEGMVVWISPRDQGRHRDSKVIFSDIVYDASSRKLLQNRGVCLGWDSNDCLGFARTLGFSQEVLRSNPIFLSRSASVADMLEPYDPRQAKLIRENEDLLIKEKLKAQMAMGYRAPIGPYLDSCGKMSAFNRMFADSLNLSEGYFDCPRCGGPIPSGQRITVCPYCHVRKEDCPQVCA